VLSRIFYLPFHMHVFILCSSRVLAHAYSAFWAFILYSRYALPHRVIDAVCDHFLSFVGERRELPVLWHQALLVFAQRYKHDVTAAQKEALKPLFKAQFHHQITPEVYLIVGLRLPLLPLLPLDCCGLLTTKTRRRRK
jgi:essential nuclear protein 1